MRSHIVRAALLLFTSLSAVACTRTVYVERPAPPPQIVVAQPAPVDPSGVVSTPPAGQVVYADPPAQPAPVTEVVTVSPGPEYIWINGDYEWVGGRWIWVGGHWARPIHPRAVWVRGGWHPVRGGGRVWVGSHWR